MASDTKSDCESGPAPDCESDRELHDGVENKKGSGTGR